MENYKRINSLPSTFGVITLTAPLGAFIGEILCKAIEHIWTQPQVGGVGRNQQYAHHQLRLESLKQQHENTLIKLLRQSVANFNEQQIVEKLRTSYSISTNNALKRFVKQDANSPFFDGIETTCRALKALYEQTKLPILVISPFASDTKPANGNSQSGYIGFSQAIKASYRKGPWNALGSIQDDYNFRPLCDDRDIDHIYRLMPDTPMVLVHGAVNDINASTRAFNPQFMHKLETNTPPTHNPDNPRGSFGHRSAKSQFDVFLCHNSDDKVDVRNIASQLERMGLHPWLDECELRPGVSWQKVLEDCISEISAAAVFIGPSGIGPWQQQEMEVYLRDFITRKRPVIPVLLPGAPDESELPVFLRNLTWVDYRAHSSAALDRLIWGITGEKPGVRYENWINPNQEIYTHISIRNLFHAESDTYSRIDLRFLLLQLPIGKSDFACICQTLPDYPQVLRDTVADCVSQALGLLFSFYHLYHHYTRPQLQRFNFENEQELEIITLLAADLYTYLSRRTPHNFDFCNTQRDVLFLERDVSNMRKIVVSTHRSQDLLGKRSTEFRCWLVSWIVNLLDMIAHFDNKENVLYSPKFPRFSVRLINAARKLLDMKVCFIIAGNFNHGKTTIINGLLGRALLPIGGAPTTAIPIVIKHGGHEEVVVQKKEGAKEELSLEEYNNKYSLNSEALRRDLKHRQESKKEWLSQLDYAELYCPIDMLKRGIEFIDTPGFNNYVNASHADKLDEKILDHVKRCDSILFVLSADQQFTRQEQDFLERLLDTTKRVIPVFFLINKWENIMPDDEEEVYGTFVSQFSKFLHITEYDSANLWGNSVFNVHAKSALKTMNQGSEIDDAGLTELMTSLDKEILNKRLRIEVNEVIEIVKTVKQTVISEASKTSDCVNAASKAKAERLQALVANIACQETIIEAKFAEVVKTYG